MNKNVLTLLCVVIIGCLSLISVYAASVDDYLVDGKLNVNSIAPSSFEESYNYVSSYLMGKEGIVRGYPGDCNSDFTVCDIDIDFEEGDPSFKENVGITYQQSNAVIKSKVDSFITSMGVNPVFSLNDLEVVNYIVNGVELTTGTESDRAIMANYSGELKSKLQYSNILADFRTATAAGVNALLYTQQAGNLVLRFNDIAYGYATLASVMQKNIIYVPTGTSEDKYLEVAQKRINDYLGNSSVVLSEGGSISEDLITDPEELSGILSDLGVSDVDQYFTLTYEDLEYSFLIVADSTKMINPTLRTNDLITGAQISTSLSEIPLDSAIDANILTSGDEYSEIIRVLDKDDVKMYDLKLYSKSLDSNITELSNGTFEVRLPVPSELEGKALVVYYVTSEGKIEEHEVTVSDGYAVFTTNHFSIYTLSEKTVSEANPKTYDGIIAWIILGTISFVGLTGAVIYRRRLNLNL